MKVQEICQGKVLKTDVRAIDITVKNGTQYQIIEISEGLQIIKLSDRHENLEMTIVNTHALNIK